MNNLAKRFSYNSEGAIKRITYKIFQSHIALVNFGYRNKKRKKKDTKILIIVLEMLFCFWKICINVIFLPKLDNIISFSQDSFYYIR